ncbi:MAG TPA: DinB family protein [Polyangiaceae bacterium]|nr:DinB family protein [Polyangiaceae bacterium]
MMSPEWLGALARYNRWMNDKLYALAATLSDDARKRDCGAFFKSIHGTFNHLLVADRVWLSRFKGVPAPEGFMAPGIRSLDQDLYSEFEALRRERALTDDELSAWSPGSPPSSSRPPSCSCAVVRGSRRPCGEPSRMFSITRPTIVDKSLLCSPNRARIQG